MLRLPRLGEQEHDPDPIVYARLYIPDTSRNWYVIEGETSFDQDFVLYCFFTTAEEYGFGDFLLSALEVTLGPEGQPVVLDLEFPEGLLTDVVPAPDS